MKTLEKKSYAVRLKKPEDIRRFLARVINDLKNGEIEIEKARATGYLCNILMAVWEKDQLEKRIEELEKRLEK